MTEVNKYTNGKIYTIRCHNYDKYYIGSTVETLSQRLATHKKDYKRYINNKRNYVSSFKLIAMGDYYIELLETYSCLSRDELHKREGQLQRQFKSEIVNICVAGRTTQEYRVDNNTQLKQYYQDNKTNILAQKKEYYITNITSIIKYREEHRDIRNAKDRQFYSENRIELLEKAKETINCICGSIIRLDSFARHKRNLIHQSYIIQQFSNELSYYNL